MITRLTNSFTVIGDFLISFWKVTEVWVLAFILAFAFASCLVLILLVVSK